MSVSSSSLSGGLGSTNKVIIIDEPLSVLYPVITNHIFSYLRRDEMLQIPSLSSGWKAYFEKNSNVLWKSLYMEQLLPGIKKEELKTSNYRTLYSKSYPNVISSDFYWDKFRARAWPKIPVPEIQRWENLVFHPEYLSIEIYPASRLGLDVEGILTLDLAKHATIPSAYVRPNPREGKIELVIPNTPENISKLTEMRSVEENQTGFEPYSWKNVRDQHGNKKEGSHWTAPNNRLIAFGKSFPDQEMAAKVAGLEMQTFADTSLFYLLTFVRSGKWPCGDNLAARTSTVVMEDGINPKAYQVTLFSEAAGPSARVTLGHNFDFTHVGAAVGEPAGSS